MNIQEVLNAIATAPATEPIQKRAVTNLNVLNEAYDYQKPSSFVRAMRIDLNGIVILLISGTASIDEHGNTVHVGDFRAQLKRTYKNITGLARSRGCDVEGHRPHNVLPAGYRARLRSIQRRAHGILRTRGS